VVTEHHLSCHTQTDMQTYRETERTKQTQTDTHSIDENQGPNSQTSLRQSQDNFRTYDNLMTTGKFTEHL